MTYASNGLLHSAHCSSTYPDPVSYLLVDKHRSQNSDLLIRVVPAVTWPAHYIALPPRERKHRCCKCSPQTTNYGHEEVFINTDGLVINMDYIALTRTCYLVQSLHYTYHYRSIKTATAG